MIEERILDFLDGRLGHSDEEELLHTLAVSPERRGTLKEHMRLRELSQSLSRSNELTVPCPTTAGLFARLGEQGFAGPVPMPLTMPIAPILPTIPAAVGSSTMLVPAASGFKFMYFAAGVVVAFLAGLSVSLLQSPTSSPVRFVHDTTIVAGQQQYTASSSTNTPNVNTGMLPIAHSTGHQFANHMMNARGVSENIGKAAQEHASSSAVQNPGSGHTPLLTESVSVIPLQSWNEMASESAAVQPLFASNLAEVRAEHVRIPILHHDDDAAMSSTLPFAFGVRTGAGPVPGGNSFNYVNSFSELKFSWQPISWFIAKASIGMLSVYETVASDEGVDPSSGIRLIGTQNVKTFVPIGSFELGLLVPIMGKQFEFAGGLGADASGVTYPRASIFTNFALTSTLSMNLGIEAMTFTHDITNSVVQKKQAFAGANLAVSDHATSERSGFIGPSIEFSWRP
jgi:hypothetical protein